VAHAHLADGRRIVAVHLDEAALRVEAVHFDEPVLVLDRAVDDDEHEIVVLVELRTLVEVLRVLDGERMEAERVAENVEVLPVRLVQVEPEEIPGREQLLAVLAIEVQLARAVVLEDAAGLERGRRARIVRGTLGRWNHAVSTPASSRRRWAWPTRRRGFRDARGSECRSRSCTSASR